MPDLHVFAAHFYPACINSARLRLRCTTLHKVHRQQHPLKGLQTSELETP